MKYPIPFDERELKLKSIQMRKDIVLQTFSAGSGHPGGSLSATEILVVLYNCIMKHEPTDPRNEERDRFVLSKGHITPAYYSILSRTGYFDPKELPTFRKFGSFLQGHPKRYTQYGMEMSGGSLGQNFSVACGMAMAIKLLKKQNNKVFDLSSEGELQEGSMWETIMSAAQFRLNNLCLIVDYNDLQIDGKASEIMDVAPLDKKFEAFNWNVISIDGHDIKAIYEAFKKFEELSNTTDRPTVIIATTVKGQGISFMANVCGWHGKAPNQEEYDASIKELEEQEKQLKENS